MNYANPALSSTLQGSTPLEVKHPYHHGDLKNALLRAARQILEEEAPSALSLREVARRAGVSHAAPYRHFASHEALLVELATEGFVELKDDLVAATALPGSNQDRIAHLGTAYMRFVTRRPRLARLMFGPQLTNRSQYPILSEAAEAIGSQIGAALHDPALGLSVWATVHGLAMLILEDVVDLGQRASGLEVLPDRAEGLLRSLRVAA